MSPKQILRIRKALGLTQEKLAELLGAQRPTIARWELGTHRPRGGYLKALRELAEKAKRKNKKGG